MKKLTLIFVLVLAATPALARAGGGGHGGFRGGGVHAGRSVGFNGGGYRHGYRSGGYGYGNSYGYGPTATAIMAAMAIIPITDTVVIPEPLLA
jgi:hypothetical protein